MEETFIKCFDFDMATWLQVILDNFEAQIPKMKSILRHRPPFWLPGGEVKLLNFSKTVIFRKTISDEQK